jgi:hypothetical protein
VFKLYTLVFTECLLTTIHREFSLTPQEREDIKEKARWLRRVANPFIDFYIIMAIGAAGPPAADEVTQRHEDRQIRDHAKDL